MTTLRRMLIVLPLLSLLVATTAAAQRAVVHTSMGDIELELYPESAPRAVENFTTHVADGYYDATTVHRVEEQFIIQMGDPDGTGYGGRSIWGEAFANEIDPALDFSRPYVLAMANRGTSASNQSQFFITLAPAPWMDGKFTIFGRVVAGQDVVDAISEVDVEISVNKPIRDVAVRSIELLDGGNSE